MAICKEITEDGYIRVFETIEHTTNQHEKLMFKIINGNILKIISPFDKESISFFGIRDLKSIDVSPEDFRNERNSMWENNRSSCPNVLILNFIGGRDLELMRHLIHSFKDEAEIVAKIIMEEYQAENLLKKIEKVGQ